MWGPTNFSLIGTAVLRFNGYKQTLEHTNKQTDTRIDKQSIFIDVSNLGIVVMLKKL